MDEAAGRVYFASDSTGMKASIKVSLLKRNTQTGLRRIGKTRLPRCARFSESTKPNAVNGHQLQGAEHPTTPRFTSYPADVYGRRGGMLRLAANHSERPNYCARSAIRVIF